MSDSHGKYFFSTLQAFFYIRKEVIAQIADTAPQINHTVPQIDDSVPQIYHTVPQINHTVPQIDDSVPQIDDTVPQINHTVPQIDDSVPQIDDSVPQIDDTVPQINDTVPQIYHIVPQIYQLFPQIYRVVPFSNKYHDEGRWSPPPPETGFKLLIPYILWASSNNDIISLHNHDNVNILHSRISGDILITLELLKIINSSIGEGTKRFNVTAWKGC